MEIEDDREDVLALVETSCTIDTTNIDDLAKFISDLKNFTPKSGEELLEYIEKTLPQVAIEARTILFAHPRLKRIRNKRATSRPTQR